MKREQVEQLADTALAELIEIDYTGFHGPVATALVRGPGAPWGPWFESVPLLGFYCESETHTGGEDCDCATEDILRREAYEHMTARGLTPIRGY
jgi:hypothetical protein